MITTILIDVDDTLLDFRECARHSIALAMDEAGLEAAPGFFDIFTEQNALLWREIEKGNLTVPELYKKRWNVIFAAAGVEYDGEAFERLFLKNLKISAIPVEGAQELLTFLHSRYTVCIASNAPYKQQLSRLTLAGMTDRLDRLFISEDIGCAKPSADFFRHCMSALGKSDPGEFLVIGDSLSSDIAGGAACGMRTCWFDRGGHTPPPGLDIDYTVKSLEAIPPLLSGERGAPCGL